MGTENLILSLTRCGRLVAASLAEYNRAVVLANLDRYDTAYVSSGKGRQRVIPCSFLGLERRFLDDALLAVPNHSVSQTFRRPSLP